MTETPGQHFADAEKAVSDLIFHNVSLHAGRKVQVINSAQFFRSLVENLRSRLFTFSASHVSKTAPNSTEYTALIRSLEVLDPQQWPEDLNIRYGETEVNNLCERFKLNKEDCARGFQEYLEDSRITPETLQPLIDAIKTLVVSTAECERIFSAMNIIHTDIRNSFKTKTVSSLLFLKCVGPPVQLFKPTKYVESWIALGNRDADYTQCPKRKGFEIPNIEYQTIWNHL